MSDPQPERWARLLTAAGAKAVDTKWYQRLATLYSEKHRHYHTFRHLAECLVEFGLAKHLATEPVAVELALWFHDAIYGPRAIDNEERSAALAAEFISAADLGDRLGSLIPSLILATKKHEPAADPNTNLIIDVDLAILGQPEKRFQEYETQIRAEYTWVPELIFAPKRAEILNRFLSRERIYQTEWFFRKYENQARANLAESLNKLKRR